MKKCLLLLLLLNCVFFCKVIISPPDMVLSDIRTDLSQQFIYWRSYGVERLLHGELPLWNRYIFCGTPYIAAIQSAIFYPPNLIFLINNIAISTNISFFMHVFLAGLGLLLFLREFKLQIYAQLSGAVTFMFSAPIIAHLMAGHLSNVNTIPWIAFAFWAVYRAYCSKKLLDHLLLGVFLALPILSGHIQYCFYIYQSVFLFVLALTIIAFKHNRKEALSFFIYFCFSGLIAIGLSAIQLLPGLEFTQNSGRTALQYGFCASYSFPPENLITFFFPEFFGNFVQTPYWGRGFFWEMCPYMGIVSLIFTISSFIEYKKNEHKKIILVLWILSGVFCILALGKYTPLFSFLYHYVPGFNLFRGQSKFIFVTVFLLSTLTGFGMNNFIQMDDNKKKTVARKYLLPVTGVVLMVFIFILICSGNQYHLWKRFLLFINNLNENITANFQEALPTGDMKFVAETFKKSAFQVLRTLIILLSFIGILFFKKNKFTPLFFSFLLIIDLFSFGMKILVMFDVKKCYAEPQLISFLQNETPPFRVISKNHMQNFGMIHKIENAEGLDAQFLKDYKEYVNYSQGDSNLEYQGVLPIERVNSLTNMMNLKYLVVPQGALSKIPPIFESVNKDSVNEVFNIKNCVPRIIFVNNVKVFPHNKVLENLAAPDFYPHKNAIVEESLPQPLNSETDAIATIKTVLYSDEKISLDVECKENGLLVLSDSYYPGWKATVNGVETKIYKTNYFARGIFLNAGNNRVEFVYYPKSFYIGTIISCIMFIILLITGLYIYLRKSPDNVCSGLKIAKQGLNASGKKTKK